ncbi:MAG: hypothetical protein ABIR67_02610 [Gaiellaceae bacterium]
MLAQKTVLQLGDVGEGEWPMLGDRFVNPDAIVSVDVLRWDRTSARVPPSRAVVHPGRSEAVPSLRAKM